MFNRIDTWQHLCNDISEQDTDLLFSHKLDDMLPIRLQSNGRVMLPKRLREAVSLSEGDELDAELPHE